MSQDELYAEWFSCYEDETLGSNENIVARVTQADQRFFEAHPDLEMFERPTIEGAIHPLEIGTLDTFATVIRTSLKGVRMRFFRLMLFPERAWGPVSAVGLNVYDVDDREASEHIEKMRSILDVRW